MSSAETIITAAIKQELQGEIHNLTIDAFREGLCTAAQMVRKCAELDQLRESLRICPEAGLEAIARAIETLSQEMHHEP